MDMLYLAISPGKEGHSLHESLFLSLPNRLPQLLSTSPITTEAIRVIDQADLQKGGLFLNVDAMKQRSICYLDTEV
jgi:hypothetical protein